MAHFDSTVENLRFPLRRDRKGVRVVYRLGNEWGPCPFACAFCGVGNSPRVTPEDNRARFDRIFADYAPQIKEPYHAAIFNEGNVTNPREFSRKTLQHVLQTFAADPNVQYVSLNSRESTATVSELNFLRNLGLPFPIHFIFGLETLSDRGRRLLGKDNEGELERFLVKLSAINREDASSDVSEIYRFGLDINLIFLPEVFLDVGQERHDYEAQIRCGFLDEIRTLLSRLDPAVPCQINIHPYYAVPSLPFRDADLIQLLRILPDLRDAVDEHNVKNSRPRVDIFVGVVFVDPGEPNPAKMELQGEIERAIAAFNETGRIPSTLHNYGLRTSHCY